MLLYITIVFCARVLSAENEKKFTREILGGTVL